MTIRPCVLRFAELMEERLRANDHKGGWSGETAKYLLTGVRRETKKLTIEVARFQKSSEIQFAMRMVAHEAADVACFAMMIADNHGALK